MALKVIIPAKTNSIRVPLKNWASFYNGFNLVEIAICRLVWAGVEMSQIYVSSDSWSLPEQERVGRSGVRTLLRPLKSTENDYPIQSLIRETVSGICSGFGSSDVAWVQVCDPLFRGHKMMLESWVDHKNAMLLAGHEKHEVSIAAVRRSSPWLMNRIFQPIGWQTGSHHCPGGRIDNAYVFPWTMTIMTYDAIMTAGYYFDRNTEFVPFSGGIDIDNVSDWEEASKYMASPDVWDSKSATEILENREMHHE